MNLFVTKEILFFGFAATAADVFTIGIALTLNLIQEYYGIDKARRTMWLGFYAALFYVLISYVHCLYIPAPADFTQSHFLALLTPMPRIIIASLVSFLIAQTVDRRIYASLQRSWKGGHFLLRNNISIIVSQLLDTIIFSFLALYGIMSSIKDIIVISYVIKLIALALVAPFLAFASKVMRKSTS
jgi:uncharacterized integral membrane protein (TIGR00697 family)